MRADPNAYSTLSGADRVSLWLGQPEGQAAIRRALRLRHLPEHFDDVLMDNVARYAYSFEAGGETIDNPPAWARRYLQLRAVDVYRSFRRQKRVVPESHDDDGDSPEEHIPDNVDQFANTHAAQDAIAIRQALISVQQRSEPWVASAALTVLSVLVDDAEPGRSCPAPLAGASPKEAAHWSGLHYAGRQDAFDAAVAPATTRQRRSRAAKTVDELLQRIGDQEGLRG